MKCQSLRIDVSALIWDYKVENEDDSAADDIDDDDSNEDNGSDEESKRIIKDEDDTCSPTGVVHANVGQKLLFCYLVRVF